MSSFKFTPGNLTAAAASLLEDRNKNPLTGKGYTRSFRETLVRRRKLPVYAYRDQFLDLMHDPKCKVVILTGETGSGKSTQLPALLLLDRHAELKKNKRKIACTEPRRLAASMLARRVAIELDVPVGEQVAFAYRNSDKEHGSVSSDSLLVYQTDGRLLQYGLSRRDFKNCDTIFIDEAHQRTAATDLLIAAIKRAQETRDDLKLVIMSATISVDKFTAYFPEAAVLEIPGRNFPVTRHFFTSAVGDRTSMAASLATRIHLYEPVGDILIFVKNLKDMGEIGGKIGLSLKALEDASHCGPVDIVNLHAKLPSIKQEKAIAPAPLSDKDGPGRKIVISTNVAEASITIDGVVYVIDLGERLIKVYDPRSGASGMNSGPASKQELAQRGGRSGRTRDGDDMKCLSAIEYFANHPDATLPGMLVEHPLETILKILSMLQTPAELLKFDLLDPPAPETVMRCLDELYYLGYIDGSGVLNLDGRRALTLGVTPYEAKMITRAATLGCSSEVITIIAMHEVMKDRKALYTVEWGPEDEDFKAQSARLEDSKRQFANGRGDMIGAVAIYNTWRSAEDKDAVCDHFMWDMGTLLEVDVVRLRIAKAVLRSSTRLQVLSLDYGDDLYFDKLSRSVVAGLFMNAAVRSRKHDSKNRAAYMTFKTQRIIFCNLEIHEVMQLESLYIVFDELEVSHGDLYMKNIMPVKLSWLVETSTKYFDPEAMPHGRMRQHLVDVIHAMSESKLSKEFIAGKQ